jgi:hypothetical protein
MKQVTSVLGVLFFLAAAQVASAQVTKPTIVAPDEVPVVKAPVGQAQFEVTGTFAPAQGTPTFSAGTQGAGTTATFTVVDVNLVAGTYRLRVTTTWSLGGAGGGGSYHVITGVSQSFPNPNNPKKPHRTFKNAKTKIDPTPFEEGS